MSIFDKEAENYDEWYLTKVGRIVDKLETECVFSLLSLPENSKILDVGCGTGNFSIKLAKKNFKIVGIDISKKMLNIARKKSKQQSLNIEFIEMDAHKLDFENEYFDGVISIVSFEFFKDPQKVMEEIFRVVKRGGSVIVGIINRESAWGKLYSSPAYKEKSVFKYAKLKTFEEMKTLKPESFIKFKECLFISTEFNLDEINYIGEQKLKKRGGFICLLWKK